MSMRRQARSATAVCMLVVWTQSFSLLGASEPDETASKPATRQSFKFDLDNGLVFVPVRIGAKEYQFVLDTGCTGIVFDTSLRPYLGQRIDTVGIEDPTGKGITLDLYAAPDAQVGSLPMNKQPVACYDFTEIREAVGRDIHGILGMDFLKDWITAIDFDEGRLDFLPAGTAKQPAWGESITFDYDNNGSPQICSTLGKDVETFFMLDTGDAGTGDLEEPFVMLLANFHEVRMTGNTRSMTISGSHLSKAIRLSQLTVGPFRHENLRFSCGNQNILGLGYLSRYRVTIDFPNQRLYLAKGKHFADRDQGSTCGLALLFKTRGIEVEFVDENSPAYAAGVRPKDILVELCGKPVSALKPSEIHRVLTAEGKPVRIAVERRGKRIDVRFTPYEYEEQPGENGTPAKPDCAGNVSQSGILAVRPCLCRRSRTRRFAFGQLRCVEGVLRSGCGR